MKSGAAAQPVAGAAKPSGGTLAARLAKLGIRGDADLVLHLPLRYEDETRLATIATAVRGRRPSSKCGCSTARCSTGRAGSWSAG